MENRFRNKIIIIIIITDITQISWAHNREGADEDTRFFARGESEGRKEGQTDRLTQVKRLTE